MLRPITTTAMLDGEHSYVVFELEDPCKASIVYEGATAHAVCSAEEHDEVLRQLEAGGIHGFDRNGQLNLLLFNADGEVRVELLVWIRGRWRRCDFALNTLWVWPKGAKVLLMRAEARPL